MQNKEENKAVLRTYTVYLITNARIFFKNIIETSNPVNKRARKRILVYIYIYISLFPHEIHNSP